MKCLVLTICLYAAESWMLRVKDRQKINKLKIRCRGRRLKVRWTTSRTNICIIEQLRIKDFRAYLPNTNFDGASKGAETGWGQNISMTIIDPIKRPAADWSGNASLQQPSDLRGLGWKATLYTLTRVWRRRRILWVILRRETTYG